MHIFYSLNNKLKQITIFNNINVIKVVYFIIQKLNTKYGLDYKIKNSITKLIFKYFSWTKIKFLLEI